MNNRRAALATKVSKARRTPYGQVAAEVARRFRSLHLPLLAAGLAYYGMLAMVPALIAVVSVYGLVADAGDVASVVETVSAAAPAEVTAFLESQLNAIVTAPSSGLGLGAAVSILAALWAASSGTGALVRGVNIAFGMAESRNSVMRRIVSLGLTLGLAVFVGVALFLTSLGPSFLEGILAFLRWPLLLVATIVGLTLLYRTAPIGTAPEWPAIRIGAVTAALGWLLASFGLSVYVSRFGSFNETYGALGAVIVTLLWLYLSGVVVLMGAVLAGTLRDRKSGEQPLPNP